MIKYEIIIDSEKNPETNTLDDILKIADIEVQVNIYYDINKGCPASFDSPEEPPFAEITHVHISKLHISSHSKIKLDDFKYFLNNEQIKEIKKITDELLAEDWKSLEDEVLEHAFHPPEDY